MPTISVTVTQAEKEAIVKQANQRNIAQSNVANEWMRAGRRLFNTEGDLNFAKLNEILGGDTPESHSQTEHPEQVREIIYRNLSTTDPTDLDEIQALIVENLVVDALNTLQEKDKIRHMPGKGYVKNE